MILKIIIFIVVIVIFGFLIGKPAKRLIRKVRGAYGWVAKLVMEPCISSLEWRENLRHILTTFNRIMSRKDITWWIDYGTLLGAYRRGGFIAWDHDGDISYLEKDKHVIEDSKNEFKACGIEVDIGYYGLFYRGTKVDIEPWWVVGERLYRVCRGRPENRGRIWRLYSSIFDDLPLARITPLWRIEYLEEQFPSPNEPKRFLRHRYLSFRLFSRLAYSRRIKCLISIRFWKSALKLLIQGCKPKVRQ